MQEREKVNILLVDDQPAKLLSYEVILQDLNENLVKTQSAREALEYLLKSDVAVILVDVVMPDLDGFQLASMIRDHPRFQKTAIIFISAVQVTDVDRMKGYEIGAVDYVPVPVVPEVLRAKVRIFVDLYRKTRELERLNRDLEERVNERTAELQATAQRLQQSDQRRTLALAAGKMGSWDWDLATNVCTWDDGQYRICGLERKEQGVEPSRLESMIHPDDHQLWHNALESARREDQAATIEFRLLRPSGEVRWCLGSVTATRDRAGAPIHVNGVTVDITERKEAEQRQALLAREVDHRSRNALAVVQSILRLSKAQDIKEFLRAVDGRIQALAIAHGLLSESRWEGADFARIIDQEFKAFRTNSNFVETRGPNLLLRPASAQGVALAIHELVTNAAKYGALSTQSGKVALQWRLEDGQLIVEWTETGGPPVKAPTAEGFGSTMIRANVEGTLDGSIRFDWRAQGLHCVITMPQTNLVHGREKRALAALMAARPVETPRAGGKIRILLVEDEALVALAMQETLQDLGYQVVGPFARNSDAMEIIGREHIDGAVLDLNVGGEPVYPVADALADRHVPYLLVTGYGTESIEDRYRSAPTLQKPVESQSLANLLKVMFKVYAPMRSQAAQQAAP